jgi:ATP-binding cassette subfamily B protein
MLLGTIYTLLLRVFDLTSPVLIAAAIDVVVEREQSMVARFGVTDVGAQLVLLVALTGIVWLLESTFDYLAQLTWRKLAQAVQHGLRSDVIRHLQSLDFGDFGDRGQGEIQSIINDDINQLERFLDGAASDALQMVFAIVIVGTMLLTTVPSLAWVAFLPVPFIVAGSLWFQALLAPRYSLVRGQAGRVARELSERIRGLYMIKSFAAEHRVATGLEAASAGYAQANEDAIRLSAAFNPLLRLIIVTGIGAVVLLGGRLVLAGELNVGVYVAVVSLTERLLFSLSDIGWLFDAHRRAMAPASRALELLDLRPRIVDGSCARTLTEVVGDIQLDDVSFSYRESAPCAAALDRVSLHVPAGQTVALVGSTGSGKTTLIKLLLRFYSPSSGRILVDGQPIDSVRLRDLRRHIGWVGDDTFLFEGSIRDNIAFGSEGASEDAILEAARAAEADDFIRMLPDGYDTRVGEHGQKLSTGQRQRLALARAILKNPSIFVLDEATSSLDFENRDAIQRSLARITRGRTTILIAHRLATVRHAEVIHVLQRGRIVASGRHDELLDSSSVYAELWTAQHGSTRRVTARRKSNAPLPAQPLSR